MHRLNLTLRICFLLNKFSMDQFIDRQLDMIGLMRKSKLQVVLNIDATSCVVQKLPVDAGSAQVFMYAIVISNPLPGSSPLAVCEFLTNDQTTSSISLGISSFKSV